MLKLKNMECRTIFDSEVFKNLWNLYCYTLDDSRIVMNEKGFYLQDIYGFYLKNSRVTLLFCPDGLPAGFFIYTKENDYYFDELFIGKEHRCKGIALAVMVHTILKNPGQWGFSRLQTATHAVPLHDKFFRNSTVKKKITDLVKEQTGSATNYTFTVNK